VAEIIQFEFFQWLIVAGRVTINSGRLMIWLPTWRYGAGSCYLPPGRSICPPGACNREGVDRQPLRVVGYGVKSTVT
jgi:hypothetical protein